MVALLPWWGALVAGAYALATGRPLLALWWAAGGLFYSVLVGFLALYRLRDGD